MERCTSVVGDVCWTILIACCVGWLCREASGYYSADAAKAVDVPDDKKFVIVIPPPNVTGNQAHRQKDSCQPPALCWLPDRAVVVVVVRFAAPGPRSDGRHPGHAHPLAPHEGRHHALRAR